MLLPSTQLEDHPTGTGNINALVNANWSTWNNSVNPAGEYLAKQDNGSGVAGTRITVTSAVDIFSADDVGALIRFATGETATITVFTTAQQVTVAETQLVAACGFEVYRSDQLVFTSLARGLTKRVRMVAGDNSKVLAWDTTLNHFVMVARPGYALTTGYVPFGAGAGADLTSSANFTFDGTTLRLDTRKIYAQNLRLETLALTYSAGFAIDFTLAGYQSFTIGAVDTTLTTSNLAQGRAVTLMITGHATTARNITFPATWKWPTGLRPPSNIQAIAALEVWMISLYSDGTTDAGVRAVAQKFV